jgi:hypothetical protein
VKGLKTTTISILTLGLLAGSTLGAAAQDEPSMDGAAVTGTASWLRELSAGTESSADGIVAVEDVVHVHSWTASDPRLGGDLTYTGNWLFDEDEGNSIQSGTYELTNDGGRWLGEATAYSSDALGADLDVVVFTGREAYEGLTAYVVIDWSSDDVSGENFKGVIFPSAMPEVPEPYVAG